MTASLGRGLRALAGAVMVLALTACGLGRQPDGDGSITDPVVAAQVNGRPIYIEDVRNYAVQRGLLQEGEDLDANSDEFFFALEEMIEVRLFATQAESEGLDREPDIRRRLQLSRERVLATAIYEELLQKASDPRAIERAYRENAARLGEGQEIHLRHILFPTRDAALAAKRRLDNGERFEALAFELSTDRVTAADGGDLGFQDANDLPEPIRQLTESTSVGQVGGPVRSEVGWHLIRLEDRRTQGVPSLETLRPQIIQWLLFQETQQLRERLESEARIERLRAPDGGVEPGGEVQPPASQAPAAPSAPADEPAAVAAAAPNPAAPGARQPPPFPFPMGPGGVYGARETPAAQTPAPEAAPRATETPPQRPPAGPAPRPNPAPAPTPEPAAPAVEDPA